MITLKELENFQLVLKENKLAKKPNSGTYGECGRQVKNIHDPAIMYGRCMINSVSELIDRSKP